MNDPLERFIKSKQTDFDHLEPGDDLWSTIDNELTKSANSQSRSIGNWWKVAAIFLLFTSAFLLIDKIGEEDKSPVTIHTAPDEFLQAEAYYSQLILHKRSEISAFRLKNASLNNEFLKDIDQLDSMYLVLKNEFTVNASSERVMDAMILNLQLRINILNQQLGILERIKNAEEDENIDS